MCRRLNIEPAIDDDRFDTVEALRVNAQEAATLVAEAIASKPIRHWIDVFTGMPGQWAVVQDTVEIASDPQVVANHYLQDMETADGDPYTLVTTPVQFDGEPARARRAPGFHEHGDAIITESLGIDWDTLIDLKLRGVVA